MFLRILNAVFYILGILLLIAVLAPFIRPSFIPFLSIVGLFFPVLWLITAVFLLLYLFIRNRRAIGAAVLLLCGLYQLSLLYNIPNASSAISSQSEIRLLSFNTGNADTITPVKSKNEAFDQATFNQADIICLQEFDPDDQKGVLALERFKNKRSVDFGGHANSKESGLSIYSRFEILDSGWLKQKGEDTYAMWCLIDTEIDTIKLINVQLQSIRLEEDELESMTNYKEIYRLPGNLFSIYSKLRRGFLWREEQVLKLKNLILESNYPVILCGDFNDPPSSYTYRQISQLFKDAFLEKGNGVGFTYAGDFPFLRIDYFLINKDLQVNSYQLFNKTHSDHYPMALSVSKN